uniref:Secreted protein n=1 Tax=Helianthus annuus TaxID=4232 RepID=A0A251T951_HELAN
MLFWRWLHLEASFRNSLHTVCWCLCWTGNMVATTRGSSRGKQKIDQTPSVIYLSSGKTWDP